MLRFQVGHMPTSSCQQGRLMFKLLLNYLLLGLQDLPAHPEQSLSPFQGIGRRKNWKKTCLTALSLFASYFRHEPFCSHFRYSLPCLSNSESTPEHWLSRHTEQSSVKHNILLGQYCRMNHSTGTNGNIVVGASIDSSSTNPINKP